MGIVGEEGPQTTHPSVHSCRWSSGTWRLGDRGRSPPWRTQSRTDACHSPSLRWRGCRPPGIGLQTKRKLWVNSSEPAPALHSYSTYSLTFCKAQSTQPCHDRRQNNVFERQGPKKKRSVLLQNNFMIIFTFFWLTLKIQSEIVPPLFELWAEDPHTH